MRRALAIWTLLAAFLLCFAGSASAYVDYGSKNRVGSFGDPFAPQVGLTDPFALELHQENTIAVYDPATGVLFYVRQNPWTMWDPLGLESMHEKKWKALAPDPSQSAGTRALATVMSVAESLNVFRSDSSIRQGGRQLDAGLAEGRENLKQNAPPVVREIGQFALGVGKTGSLGMNAAGLAEFGETAIQQGVVETGKNMATGLVSGLKNDPVETLSSLASPSALGKATLGKTARTTKAESTAMTKVTSWADEGMTPDLNPGRWVMKGGKNKFNFLMSGLPGPKVYLSKKSPYVKVEKSKADYDNSITGEVPSSSLERPGGLDNLKIGQRKIKKEEGE